MDWKNHDPQTLLGELQSGDDDRSERAVHRVAELGERMLPLLLEQLQSQEPDQRWWATAALTHINREEARKALLVSLVDEDTAVRQCAAFGLRRHPYVDAIPSLINLLGDQDRLLARLAADALAALGDQQLGVTLGHLAKGLPVYDVMFSEGGAFEVRDAGSIPE